MNANPKVAEAVVKPRSSRGNEAQTSGKLAPPYVGCYKFEIGSANWKATLRSGGFTLVELLVVISLVAIGGLMLSPGLARTQPNSRTAQCLSNKRQVALACGMYSQDWNDYLVPNAPANDYRGWCNGMENWTTAAANININYYTTNCLAPYVGGQVRLYKCPGDTIPSDNGDRIRSISMNGMMLGAIPTPGAGQDSYNSGWRVYSLNDGYLQMGLNTFSYPDVPAAYHGGINCLTFGDGHVEPHKWVGNATYYSGIRTCPYAKGVTGNGNHWQSGSLDTDFYWLRDRTSARQ